MKHFNNLCGTFCLIMAFFTSCSNWEDKQLLSAGLVLMSQLCFIKADLEDLKNDKSTN